MGQDRPQILAFNRGVISPYALARVDLARMRYSASIQTNWMPRVFGRMMLRPGLMYTGIEVLDDAPCLPIPFVRATTDTALIEATDSNLRFIVNDALISRVSVSSAVTNGTFSGAITGWTTSETGAGSAAAYVAPNQLGLTGSGNTAAVATQQVTVAGGDIGVRHALRIVINRGPVTLRVGSAVDLDDFVEETTLGAGTHSIAFTPTGDFFIYFASGEAHQSLVGSVAVEGPGTLLLPSPWLEADLPNIRWDQSVDILYLCDGRQMQKKIERRATDSWSIVDYAPEDGPFGLINTSYISLTPSALTGNINITASAPFFKSSQIGALFRIASVGQKVTAALSAGSSFSDPILVDGSGPSRNIAINITGTWVGTLTLQYSVGSPGAWADSGVTYTGNATDHYNDGFDNQVLYYRIGFAGLYTSGTANVTLTLPSGSLNGIARITGITSKLIATATVLSAMGGTSASTQWWEGLWSDLKGFPSEVQFQEGRLWWFGKNYFFGSIGDAYDSYDDTVVGDNGPIIRTISSGPADNINWSLGVMRLLVGTDGSEISARSSSLDEPLTPTNFNLKFPSNQGSARLAAIKVDDHGYFVQRGGLRVYDMAFDSSNYVKLDYIATDMTALVPEIGDPLFAGTTFNKLIGQRQPDTRLHCIRTDGTVGVMVTDKVEQVVCWINVESPGADGVIETGCSLPGQPEDQVYYIVKRTIGGVVRRFWEKWALEKECRGQAVNKQADCAVLYDGALTNVLSAPHLIGQQVIVWADGLCLSPVDDDGVQKTYLVDGGGNVTLDAGVTVRQAVVGLPYAAQFQGVKLAYAAQFGSALTQTKSVSSIGFILADAHTGSLRYGADFDHLDPMPSVEEGAVVDPNKVWAAYDFDAMAFNDAFGTDTRICLTATAPMPCSVLAVVFQIETDG